MRVGWIVATVATATAAVGVLPPTAESEAGGPYTVTRKTSPARSVVTDSAGQWVATFTDGARSVTLKGEERTFAEPGTTAATVATDRWVRVLPAPFAGTVDLNWLAAAEADRSPDLLALSMQYIEGASPTFVDSRKVAHDADFGPLQPDGQRAEGSDFNDYLGIPWKYGTYVDVNEPDQIDALDCSGYMRMLWGYRSGLPMRISKGTGLPRRAVDQAKHGVSVVANTGKVPSGTGDLAAGDLVFFDASTDDGTAIDHVGMYLGRDSEGRLRFISSRKTANGPTMGDVGGRSALDGGGYYAKAFRSVRRL